MQLPLKAARKHPGRQELPADLPRKEQIIACTPEQCVCGNCGKRTTVIGYETSEQLDVEPAKYFVRMTKREKRACKDCEEQGVQSAPLPARIINPLALTLTAAAHPDRVHKLVVLSVPHPLAPHALRQREMAWYQLFFQFEGIAEAWLQHDDWVLAAGVAPRQR